MHFERNLERDCSMEQRRRKKKRFKKIYNVCKRTAFSYFQEQKYESTLSIISVAATFMYKVNMIYVDKDFENIIRESANRYISLKACYRKVIILYILQGLGRKLRELRRC